MMLIWLSGQGEADNLAVISLYVGVLRLNSFVGRSRGLSRDGVVKSHCDGSERLFFKYS